MKDSEKSTTDYSILWRRLDRPGHDAARLGFQDGRWHLTGTAVFGHQQQPCRLEYMIICNSEWQTLSGRVTGWVGNKTVGFDLSAGSDRRWWLNGIECPEAAGCVDVDFGFTPATNLLPIRRLDLAIGKEAEVKAAWLGFPRFTLEALPQRYRRVDETIYRYESGGGKFAADLQVNRAGFVTHYPGRWQMEASA